MKRKRKLRRPWRWLILAIIIISFWQIIIPTVRLLPYESKAIVVYDMDQQKEIINLNGKQKRAPASLVKILTVYTALEMHPNLDVHHPIDAATREQMVAQEASLAGFKAGENVTMRDLLYGTMLASGGECAQTLAISLYGGEAQMVEQMNATAENIGMHQSHFSSVEGLDQPEQYTSAHDIAWLLKTALNNPDFYAIFTRGEYRATATPEHPTGLLIRSTVLSRLQPAAPGPPQILGGKSGTTKAAGLCWATLAEKAGHRYVIVTMGAPFQDFQEANDAQLRDTLKILEDL